MSEGSRICDIIGQFWSNGMLPCQQEAPYNQLCAHCEWIHLLEDHARRTSRLHFEVVDIFTIIKNSDVMCHIKWCEITSKYTGK